MQISKNTLGQISIKLGDKRNCFNPGDFEGVVSFAPELLDEVKKIWTDDVIAQWQAYMEEQNQQFQPDFASLKRLKLSEVNQACQSIIAKGVDVPTSQGTKHFSLSAEDQMNLTAMAMQLQAALKGEASTINPAKGVPYHCDGELCTYWRADDFAKIADTATNFVFYHTTYANHLRHYVNRITDDEELQAVCYGMDLPDDLKQSMAKLME